MKVAVRGGVGEFAGFGGIGAGNDEDGFGAEVAGEHGLVLEPGVAVEFDAAFGGGVFGHITQHKHDLVGDVESGVGVVAFTGFSRKTEPVAGEGNRT